MRTEKDGSITLDVREASILKVLATNIIRTADLNELKTLGFVHVADTFITEEVALFLEIINND